MLLVTRLLWVVIVGILGLARVVFLVFVKGSRQAPTLQELLNLTPRQFEDAIAQMLRDLGYRSVRRVGGAGDLGVDISCRDRHGRLIVVQCKQYKPGRKVGSPTVQTLIGMAFIHHRADRAMLVTTAGFTREALSLAQRHGIRLIDGMELTRIWNGAATPKRWTTAGTRSPKPVEAVAGLLGLCVLLSVVSTMLDGGGETTSIRTLTQDPANGRVASTAPATVRVQQQLPAATATPTVTAEASVRPLAASPSPLVPPPPDHTLDQPRP